MIKKPEEPTLADYVRGNEEVIKEKWQAVHEYKKKVFDGTSKDFETDNAFELVIRMAEKYHEPFRQKEKQGRKPKWTPQIELMLAVLIELRRDDEKKTSVEDEIEWILSLPAWGNFAQKGNEKSVDGFEVFKKRYQSGLKDSQFQLELDSYRENPKEWLARLVKLIKG